MSVYACVYTGAMNTIYVWHTYIYIYMDAANQTQWHNRDGTFEHHKDRYGFAGVTDKGMPCVLRRRLNPYLQITAIRNTC